LSFERPFVFDVYLPQAYIPCGSRDVVFGIVTRLGDGQQRERVFKSPSRTKDVSVIQNFQAGPEAHPPSYAGGTLNFPTGVKLEIRLHLVILPQRLRDYTGILTLTFTDLFLQSC
jgi:hypothetical protein